MICSYPWDEGTRFAFREMTPQEIENPASSFRRNAFNLRRSRVIVPRSGRITTRPVPVICVFAFRNLNSSDNLTIRVFFSFNSIPISAFREYSRIFRYDPDIVNLTMDFIDAFDVKSLGLGSQELDETVRHSVPAFQSFLRDPDPLYPIQIIGLCRIFPHNALHTLRPKLIYDNAASLKDRGTHFALKRLKVPAIRTHDDASGSCQVCFCFQELEFIR